MRRREFLRAVFGGSVVVLGVGGSGPSPGVLGWPKVGDHSRAYAYAYLSRENGLLQDAGFSRNGQQKKGI